MSFLPLIVRSMGSRSATWVFVLAVPPLIAMLSQPLWGVWSDSRAAGVRFVACRGA